MVPGYYTEKIGAAKMLQNLKASVTSGGAVTGGAGGGGVVSGTVVDHHPLSPTNAPINPLSATQVDNRYAHYRKKRKTLPSWNRLGLGVSNIGRATYVV